MAYTGVAAMNVDGRTIHSARNIKFGGYEQRSPPTNDMKVKYSQVVLSIIDESSMTQQKLLGGANLASKSLVTMKYKTKPFGGKHMLITGDWLQFQPVAGKPCTYLYQYLDLECMLSNVMFLVHDRLLQS